MKITPFWMNLYKWYMIFKRFIYQLMLNLPYWKFCKIKSWYYTVNKTHQNVNSYTIPALRYLKKRRSNDRSLHTFSNWNVASTIIFKKVVTIRIESFLNKFNYRKSSIIRHPRDPILLKEIRYNTFICNSPLASRFWDIRQLSSETFAN